MPQIIGLRRAFFVLAPTFVLLTITSHQLVFGQRTAKSAPPDFFVRISNQKRIFYHDESINWGVFRRQLESAKCSFGGWGTFQILRNGQVTKEEKTGVLSRLSSSNIGGVPYHGYGMSISPSFFVSDSEINPKDNYRLRATCGGEVSAPSKPFHVSLWSEPTDGLQVLIRPLKKTYQAGEAILIEATMRNLGARARVCPVPLADDGRQRTFWTLETPYREDPRPMWDDNVYYAHRLGVLKPGQSRSAIFSLNQFRAPGIAGKPMFGSRPGTYQVWFTVFFHQEDEDVPVRYRKNLWRGDMTTNIIEIVAR